MASEAVRRAKRQRQYIPNDPCVHPVKIATCCPRCGADLVQTGYGDPLACQCGCRWSQVDVGYLRLRIRELLSLIDELTDPADCSYDHHANCQAHSLGEKPCPHERAKSEIKLGKGAAP